MKKTSFGDVIDNGINGLNIKTELDKEDYVESKVVLKELYTKTDVLKILNGTKDTCEKWFNGKDDDCLLLPFKMYEQYTNFEIINIQIEHLMYHIGYCEAIFRENNIEIRKYLEYE
ncbi:hypothetical protein FACS1894172_16800 [Spirochaetia bacterium]|nr:hypothetical protein FACS1894172_16800 [Spirochaetia bacterium]